MKSIKNLGYGDLVKIKNEEVSGFVGIVTKPITEQHSGHVLIHKDGYIQGMNVSIDDVESAELKTEGFAQLAYNLIKLGSHVIEKRLLELI